MDASLLDILRCPFCGTRLTLVDNPALARTDNEIESGVLGCECCAFPIVEGIPVLIASARVRDAMHQLEGGQRNAALYTLLELDGDRLNAFKRFRSRDEGTYREGLKILSVDAEAEYFVYRFSDPTFRVARAVVLATGPALQRGGRYLDLCGGSGHLVRSMISDHRAVLADVYFWKLWLAKSFVAPHCEPVCCDANNPLPFTRGTFSLVALSDAFPYIWHKRLLIDEMMRLAGPDGTIVMPHLHSALGENFSAGMPLTPAAYHDLLQPHHPRLFRDSALFEDVLRGVIDLSRHEPPEALAGEPALVIVASHHDEIFRETTLPDVVPAPDTVIVNPLYRVDLRGNESVLTLTFPTPEYEEEFAAARRYLPASVTIPGDVRHGIDPSAIGHDRYAELCRNLVLIAAPPRYA
jgi:uncharacterized protein YbaR (Trm112 family)/ubiquinone/menaquinone biosynthesis C-methylase UbiE